MRNLVFSDVHGNHAACEALNAEGNAAIKAKQMWQTSGRVLTESSWSFK